MRKLIVNSLKNIVLILSGLQIVFPLLAFLFLLSWILRLMHAPFYQTLNHFLWLLPNIIDSLFHPTADLYGEDVPMGYVYSSAISLIMTFICTFFVNKVDKAAKQIDYLRKTKDIREDIKEKNLINAKIEKQISAIDKFYGLVEFRLSKQSDFFKNTGEMTELKKEFSKMAAKKLKEKYPFLHIAQDDKIFFICEDFNKFNSIVNDIVRIFKLFSKLSRERDISPELIFSNYAPLKKEKNSKILETLTNINKLSFYNKIIVSKSIKERYEYTKDIRFSFIPLGTSKLDLKDGELDVELYYLKNM